MELDELLALITATIFAADPRSRNGNHAEAARQAVGQADMIWRCICRRKEIEPLPYYAGPFFTDFKRKVSEPVPGGERKFRGNVG